MSEATNNKFFGEFTEVDKKSWKEQIIKDLKGADYNEKLVLKSGEGFDIQPFYHEEDLKDLNGLNQYSGWSAEATVNSLSPRQWENRAFIEVIDPAEANKQAILALQNGVDGVSFKLTETVDAPVLSRLLKDILLEYCAVSFTTTQPADEFGKLLLEYVKTNQYPPDQITGSLNVNASNLDAQELDDYISLLSALKSYQVFVIEGDSDPNNAKVLGSMLANTIKLIDLLISRGLKAGEIIGKIEFKFKATNDYFKQIALVRALRMLIDLVVKQYGVTDFDPSGIKIHTITTILVDDQTQSDPYMNMLSNTNQAMASIIGGCNVLTVLPHNLGIEELNPFAQRIARNVSNVLKEESYLDKVADPASGSYYIENLTNQIAEKSWEECQLIIDNK